MLTVNEAIFKLKLWFEDRGCTTKEEAESLKDDAILHLTDEYQCDEDVANEAFDYVVEGMEEE